MLRFKKLRHAFETCCLKREDVAQRVAVKVSPLRSCRASRKIWKRPEGSTQSFMWHRHCELFHGNGVSQKARLMSRGPCFAVLS